MVCMQCRTIIVCVYSAFYPSIYKRSVSKTDIIFSNVCFALLSPLSKATLSSVSSK